MPATGTENTKITSCLSANCLVLPMGGLATNLWVCCADYMLILPTNLLKVGVGEPRPVGCAYSGWLRHAKIFQLLFEARWSPRFN